MRRLENDARDDERNDNHWRRTMKLVTKLLVVAATLLSVACHDSTIEPQRTPRDVERVTPLFDEECRSGYSLATGRCLSDSAQVLSAPVSSMKP
jgi:hypothetical protein